MTATGGLDEELTVPDDDWRPLEDELVALDELLAGDAALLVEAATPGIVISLMAPKIPTPATAAKAMPAVKLLSCDSARSRALILASAALVFSMLTRLRPASQSSL